MTRTLRLERIDAHGHQLSAAVSCAGYRFATSWWYGDVNLGDLRGALGDEAFEYLVFHVALFEVNKVASLRPDVLDLGPYARFHTRRLEALWREVFVRVWAQWRYHHDLPDYRGPDFASAPRADEGPALVRPRPVGDVSTLAFCGGGKDSLVVMRLLERAGVAHAALGYAHAGYGPAEPQHTLIDGLLDVGPARRRHRLSIYDDFSDAPLLALAPELGVNEVLAAETPASMFAALPLLLAHGYRDMVLGHEHSANVGNLRWAKTGEDVNHQWGKSLEAEALLDTYLREVMLPDARWYSVLQPAHDVLLFQLLAADPRGVERTHSCNVDKPWCERCAKCAYVWLGYQAHLDGARVAPLFRTHLFDTPELQLPFRQMLGLEAHTPFECIGQIDEVRLAFELCYRKGLRGAAMDVYEAEVRPVDTAPILERTLRVMADEFRAPTEVRVPVLSRMRDVATDARARLARVLAP